MTNLIWVNKTDVQSLREVKGQINGSEIKLENGRSFEFYAVTKSSKVGTFYWVTKDSYFLAK